MPSFNLNDIKQSNSKSKALPRKFPLFLLAFTHCAALFIGRRAECIPRFISLLFFLSRSLRVDVVRIFGAASIEKRRFKCDHSFTRSRGLSATESNAETNSTGFAYSLFSCALCGRCRSHCCTKVNPLKRKHIVSVLVVWWLLSGSIVATLNKLFARFNSIACGSGVCACYVLCVCADCRRLLSSNKSLNRPRALHIAFVCELLYAPLKQKLCDTRPLRMNQRTSEAKV